MPRWARIGLLGGLAVVALAVGAFLLWASTPLGPSDDALAALASDDRVRASRTGAGYEFRPASAEPTSALVLYPGGRVDLRSYAPFARDVAAAGHLVVVCEMPLSLAVLDLAAADEVLEDHPGIETWVIGGHSLGGAMAASYLGGRQSTEFDGLLLLAAYATEGADLSGRALDVTDVTGSRDTVLDASAHEAGRALLPSDARFIVIRGGNHAQFGSYGAQPGDAEASIPADEQRARTVSATLDLMERAGAR